MKRNLFRAAIVAIAVMVGLGAYAQDEVGDMAAGGNVGVNIGDGITNFGIGGKFQFNVVKLGSGIIRGEGAFNYYLSDGTLWDLSVNGHYLINLPAPKLTVYPLAGLSLIGLDGSGDIDDCTEGDGLHMVGAYNVVSCEIYNRDYGGNCPAGGIGGNAGTFIGLNLGGGVQYELKPNILLQGEVKYRAAKLGARGLGVSVGVAFKF